MDQTALIVHRRVGKCPGEVLNNIFILYLLTASFKDFIQNSVNQFAKVRTEQEYTDVWQSCELATPADFHLLTLSLTLAHKQVYNNTVMEKKFRFAQVGCMPALLASNVILNECPDWWGSCFYYWSLTKHQRRTKQKQVCVCVRCKKIIDNYWLPWLLFPYFFY